MKKFKTQEQVDRCLQSIDGIQKAAPNPYLLTRVKAAIRNKEAAENNWIERMAAFISKPNVALILLVIILAVNITIMLTRNETKNSIVTEQNGTDSRDEYALNNTSIYYIENPEP